MAKTCTKCGKSEGPFQVNKARCNLCLAEDQRAYVNRQPKDAFAKKHRKQDAAYRLRQKLNGIKRVISRRPGYFKEKWVELRNAILAKYGNKCARCGFSDPRALQVDHVNGGGSKERREWSSNHSYYKKVFDDTTGKYQLLCANCNWIKRYENKERA